jgi:hypothetical protein
MLLITHTQELKDHQILEILIGIHLEKLPKLKIKDNVALGGHSQLLQLFKVVF